MSAIDDLIAQVQEPRLREQFKREWAEAQKAKKFGLVFDRHLPEFVPIPKARPRRGDLVSHKGGSLTDLWRVRRVSGETVWCVRPEGAAGAGDFQDWPLDELVVVRQFDEPIFPALTPMDQVQNGPDDAPWHCLIEADNFHALQLLDYLYAGKVDCIYIDPPYNTGARDWKYNNDEEDGSFRADLGSWERELLAEELTDLDVVGWLRNLDRKPWSLEIPYQTGGEKRPMFPDLVVVRRGKGGSQGDYRFDILEPHGENLPDDFEKAAGLARFAERHGHLFHRIQLIRKQVSKAGGERFFRLELNSETVRKQVLPVTSNVQLDAVFGQFAV